MSDLPRTEIELRTQVVPASPHDVGTHHHVVGVTSAGPFQTPRTLTRMSDLSEFGYGPGVRMAAAILARGGGPVYLTRPPTGTASALSSARKFPGAVDAQILYGGLLADVAGDNGDVFYTSKTSGVSIKHTNPGAAGALSIVTTETADGYLIEVILAHDGAAVTSTAALIEAAVNADPDAQDLVVADAQGTGAAVSAAFAETLIENGDISYLPRQPGVRVRHVASGNNTPLTVGVSGGDVTVNLATDADGTPTSTAALVVAKILDTPAARLLLTPTASGDGSGKAGVWAFVTLTYGSTAALTLSGTPVDRFRLRLECRRAGTVGGATTPTVRWSLDDGEHWTAEQAMPASGALILQNRSIITTGITATFTGVLAVGDLWLATSTEPTAAQADLVDTVEIALADKTRKFGCVVVAQPLARSEASEIDDAAQAAWATAFSGALVNARDENAGEAPSAWRDSLINDYLGLDSASGILRVGAGYGPLVDPKTGWTYHSPLAMFAAGHRAASPVHMAISQVKPAVATSGGTRLIMGGPVQLLGRAEPGVLLIGGVHYQARESGVAVQHAVQSGLSLPYSVDAEIVATPSGQRVIVTVTLGTDGAGVVNTTNAQVIAAVNVVDAVARYVVATLNTAGTATATAVAQEIPDRPVSHDEFAAESLDSQRFLTFRSFAELPGEVYFTRDRTFADPAETGYERMHKADVIYSVARLANARGVLWLQRVLPSIPVAESEVVPKGALTEPAADAITADVSQDPEAFLFRPKLDGQVSASPYEPGERAAQALRDYSYKDSKEIRILVTVRLLETAEVVRLIVQPR